MCLWAADCLAEQSFELEPGTHEIPINGQTFEIYTEVTIDLTFEFVDECRAAGSITNLDPGGPGWVRLTWLDQAAVILDQMIEVIEEFDYSSSETGHAERKRVPKFGQTIPVLPSVD
jgi:hypothetical protein